MAKVFDAQGNLISDDVQKKTFDGNGNLIEQAFNPQLKGVTEGFAPEKRIRTFKDVGRELIPKIRPFARAAGVAAGIASGGSSIPISAALGLLGGAGTDLAMQEAEKGFGGTPAPSFSSKAGLVPPNSVMDAVAGAGEGMIGDELGGHVVRGVGRMFKGLIRPGPYTAMDPMSQRLGDTYQAMIDKGGGPTYSQQNDGQLKHVESIFGGAPQRQQLQNAAQAGRAVSKDVLRSVTEQPEISYGNYPSKTVVQPHVPGATDFKQSFEYPQEMTQLLGARAKDLTNRANANADKVRMIAQTRPFNSRYSSTGIESDKGPIVPTSMVLKADEFLRDAFGADYHTRGIDQKFGLVADEEKPLIRTALDILKYAKETRQYQTES